MTSLRLFRSFVLIVSIALLIGTPAILVSAAPHTGRLQEAGEPTPGGTLRMAISEEPDQLDPARTIELLAGQLMGNVLDALVYIGDDGLPHGWVAESWQIAPDGKVITFKIRPGIKFHDGTPLDAAAVKFGYDRILDPAMAAPYKEFLGTLQKVDAPDPATVAFTFSEPYAAFFVNGATIGIVSPAGVAQFGDDFGHNPIGSGPFKFREWQAGSKIVFERNPDYVNFREDDTNKGPAYVEALEYNVIPEAATQTAAFEAGELDLLDVPREDLARLSEDPDVEIVTLEKSNNLNFIEFANRPPFNNPSFRKAVSYSIDRQAIIDLAYVGNATVNQCPVPINNAAYDEALCAEHGYTFDQEKAKQMLAEAGWTDGDGNGIVEMEGKDLQVTLWSYAPYPTQSKTIEIMQADLNEVGIGTDIQVIEFGAMQPMLESGEIGFDYMRWTFSDQSILTQLFKTPGWTKQTSDPALDALLVKADTTVDPVARLEASRAAMVYVLDNAMIAPVISDWIQTATGQQVHNYHWDALVNERLNDVWLTS
ncbi:MAG: Oligopeptide ABC transporter, periplasmic oligopeptide-binding protein OppA [uncultured Thermomicrobiales bacterium]|uniref:Oligopeptide ABC transporter, periplasmic oligopeptide-binding protein OppA n=1 Tax=uncultured Thermomicrobiales bacterium TaxID=1645740 RepID=A0A6J4VVV4_9BACT|nr:MAG: Oligopeptide ABC transporter, periplasmic oligopeptide-binding protein OppA [uncultured Thermomicrobiales bacterium]